MRLYKFCILIFLVIISIDARIVQAQEQRAYAPHYPGGDLAFREWVRKNIYQDYNVLKADIKGSVDATWGLDIFGQLIELKINNSTNPQLNTVLYNTLPQCPAWIPAKDDDGRPIKGKVRYKFCFTQQEVSNTNSAYKIRQWLIANIYKKQDIVDAIDKFGYSSDFILLIDHKGHVTGVLPPNPDKLHINLNQKISKKLAELEGWIPLPETSDTTIIRFAKVHIAIPGKAPNINSHKPEGDSLIFKGRVLSYDDMPITDAIITTKNSQKKVTTSFDGSFCFCIPRSGDIILITQEGKAPFRCEIKNSCNIAVILDEKDSRCMEYKKYTSQLTAVADSYYKEGLKHLNEDSISASNTTKVITLFNKATCLGHNDAIYQLAVMYDEGKGVGKDIDKAICLYKQVVNNSSAHTRLGQIFEEGIGVPSNYGDAAMYYRLAIQEGDTVIAKNHLLNLDKLGVKENFLQADENPKFPGGDNACFNWLFQHLSYPQEAAKQRIEGRVLTRFVIDIDGSITDVEILDSPHPSLSLEAIRVISAMPRWKPAKKGNSLIRAQFHLPIMFKLP